MSPVVILCVVGACCVAAFPVARIIAGRKSFVGAAFSILLGFFAAMGALHAWGESRSVPWTAGYGGFTLLCLISAIVQLMPDRNRAGRFPGDNAGAAPVQSSSSTTDNPYAAGVTVEEPADVCVVPEALSLPRVAGAFALSGLVSGIIAVLMMQLPFALPAGLILLAVVLLVSHSVAAKSLGVQRLPTFGVGLAVTLGTIFCLPAFIGTQALKGNETFLQLFPSFAGFYFIAFLASSAIGLPMTRRYGSAAGVSGLAGFLMGAVINAMVVSFVYSTGRGHQVAGFLAAVLFFVTPGVCGSVAMAHALNKSFARRSSRIS